MVTPRSHGFDSTPTGLKINNGGRLNGKSGLQRPRTNDDNLHASILGHFLFLAGWLTDRRVLKLMPSQ